MNNNAAAVLGGFLCVLLIALPVGLAIAAAILRAAISLTNKVVGRPADRDDDWDRYDEGDEDDYERPRRRRARRSGRAVPEPSFLAAMGIVLLIGVVNAGVGFGIGLVVGIALHGDPRTAQIVAQLIGLPVGFLVNAGILTPILPTTFPRACLVTLFQYLISIAIAIVIVGVILLVVLGVGGMAVPGR